MFGFLKPKRPSLPDQLKTIASLDEPLRFHLYLELLSQYEAQMNRETASVLAVQVSNYLMGDDFAKVYNSAGQDVQKKIDAIKDLIEVKGTETMTNNEAVRELVIRHTMTTFLIYHCLSHLLDKGFFDRPEMRNREELMRKYDYDFPDVENFDRYMAFALNFIQTTEQIHEQRIRDQK